jgi:hypothetical protein
MEVSGQFSAPAALPPGKEPPISIIWWTGRAPERVWTLWCIDNKWCTETLTPVGNRTRFLGRPAYSLAIITIILNNLIINERSYEAEGMLESALQRPNLPKNIFDISTT